VTIRIDQLKELKLETILEAFASGHSWLLCRKNDKEGLVENHTVDQMQQLVLEGAQTKALKLWRCSAKALGKDHLTRRNHRVKGGGACSGASDSSSKTGPSDGKSFTAKTRLMGLLGEEQPSVAVCSMSC